MEKRIYSLSKIAFIKYITGINPEFERDEQGVVYARYPECDAVSLAIKSSQNPEAIINYHKFTGIFKDIKKQISIAARNAF